MAPRWCVELSQLCCRAVAGRSRHAVDGSWQAVRTEAHEGKVGAVAEVAEADAPEDVEEG